MSLESLSSYFGSSKAKNTIQKAQQAHQIGARIKEKTGVEVSVFLRKTSIVIKCPDQASAARLQIDQVQIDRIINSILGSLPKVRLTVDQG